MILARPPEPIDHLVDSLAFSLDKRHRDLLEPLFLGELLSHGRRTATAWFRAGGISEEFRRGYTLLGTIGRSKVDDFARRLFWHLREDIDPGPRWLFALDDSPTKRYGPCVEGAGIHHNPTPGPAQQKFLYGHVWVTTAWVVNHPDWHTRALPLIADLYIRQQDLAKIAPDHRPEFVTKLDQAGRQIVWAAEQVRHTGKPIWAVVDGFYAKRPVLRPTKEAGVVIVGKLQRNAGLRDLPRKVLEGERGRGRPRTYGNKRISLAKRAGQPRGWVEVECFQYQKLVTKKVKTFLATWKPAAGVIRVVIVQEEDEWLPYFCTDSEASVRDILEAVAGRTAIEDTFKDVKEVEGAGQQQLRYGPANVGAFNWCLWGYTAVEWWAWDKPFGQLTDRSNSPWDTEERRPSHADRRKALQHELLEDEFWRVWGDRPCPPKIRQLVEELFSMAA
jgi:DDE superfamily endonuclease